MTIIILEGIREKETDFPEKEGTFIEFTHEGDPCTGKLIAKLEKGNRVQYHVDLCDTDGTVN